MIAAKTTITITLKLKRDSAAWIFAIAANIAFALRRIIPNSYVYIGRGKEIHQRLSLHGVWLNGMVVQTKLWHAIALSAQVYRIYS